MSISELISGQRRDDGQIIPGVYAAFEVSPARGVIRVYIGTTESGPMLQYEADGNDRYAGSEINGGDANSDYHRDFPDGCWTPLYSRGDYGKRYAYGGHWSGHTRNLHPSIGAEWGGQQRRPENRSTEILVLDDGQTMTLPDGIKGEIKQTRMDCSSGWTIWYPSAAAAMSARLNPDQMAEAKLPDGLIRHERESADKVRDLIDIYRL